MDKHTITNDYVIIKALDDGVNVIGLTRGKTHASTIQKSWIKGK